MFKSNRDAGLILFAALVLDQTGAGSDLSLSALASFLYAAMARLEVVVFLAGDEANFFQRRELLLGFGRLAKHQIELTEMFVGAAVAAIERQRPLVMLHRRPQLPQPAIGIADVVLDIGVGGSRSAASLSAAIAAFQSSATSALLPAAKSGSSCAQSASDPIDAHRGADRPVFQGDRRLGRPFGSAEPRRNRASPRRLG